jgi:hypothetical protein
MMVLPFGNTRYVSGVEKHALPAPEQSSFNMGKVSVYECIRELYKKTRFFYIRNTKC